MREWLAFLGTACLVGCGDSDSAAGVAATVQHCGGEAIASELWTRVSRYSIGVPSNDVYVLQLCHPDRGCSPVASYKNAVIPIAKLQNDGLNFVIPGAGNLKLLKGTSWVAGRAIPVTVTAPHANPDGGHRIEMRGCHADWELRPYSEPAPHG